MVFTDDDFREDNIFNKVFSDYNNRGLIAYKVGSSQSGYCKIPYSTEGELVTITPDMHYVWSDEFKNQVACLVVNVDRSTIPLSIDDYYLFDVGRYFKNLAVCDISFLDFLDYEINGEDVIVDTKGKNISYKYRVNRVDYYLDNSSKQGTKEYLFYLEGNDDFGRFDTTWKIEIESGKEVIKHKHFVCDNNMIDEFGENYYADLFECVDGMTNYTSQHYTSNNQDVFEATFDYRKLVELFGFN